MTNRSALPFLTAVCALTLLGPIGSDAAVQRAALQRPLDPRGLVSGTVTIQYELYSPDAPAAGSLPTIVAVEGGPGGASTGSAGFYLDAFGALLDTHQLLLVDLRGTGRSEPLTCAGFQRRGYTDPAAIARCGDRLGARAWRYTSAFAADDLAAVLDHLGIDRVTLYGDSYGSFFAQSFALLHPGRLQRLVLDGAYPVAGLDPWYPELGEAIRLALRRVCARDSGCAARGGDPVDRLAQLVSILRQGPLIGRAPDAHGQRRNLMLDAPGLAALVASATYEWQMYRELDPAVRAALAGDPTPLLRLVGEQRAPASRFRDYSQALESAVSCADYPQLYDMTAPPTTRRGQYAAALAAFATTSPGAFAPFDLATWVASPFSAYTVCLDWPSADAGVPPFPTPRAYPDVPVLVLNGDLDTITPSAMARAAAAPFPRAIFVEVANAVHVTALGSTRDCSPQLLREFIATDAIADSGCAARTPPVRVLDAFWAELASVPVAVGPPLGEAERRLITVALATFADVLNRRPALYGSRGRGLRGGRYRFLPGSRTGVRLRAVELVAGVPIDGSLVWDEGVDLVEGALTVAGLNLAVSWSPVLDRPTARVTVAGWTGDLRVP